MYNTKGHPRIHDDVTGRVCGTDLPVDEGTWAELSQLKLHDADGVTRQDLRTPLLVDYIQICRHYGKTAVLELKNAFTMDDIARIYEICGEENMIYITFELQNLIYLRELSATATAQFLYNKQVDDPDQAAELIDWGVDYITTNILE